MDYFRLLGWLLRSTYVLPPPALAYSWSRIAKSKADGVAIGVTGVVTISLTWWLLGVWHQELFGDDGSILRHTIVYSNLAAMLIAAIVLLVKRGGLTRSLSLPCFAVAGAWTVGAPHRLNSTLEIEPENSCSTPS